MRPKITSSHSITRSLRYNEEKIGLGKAECILAANFVKDLSHLSFEDKLYRFKHRMELNDKVSTSLHITLNFDPLDQLSNDRMTAIAKQYMKDIGFKWQPYLVYRHHDAGHPHCHIVTTHVNSKGNPMDLYNIGRNRSEKARQHIETAFDLVTAEKKQQLLQQQQQIDGLQKIKYGESSMARQVARVIEHVMKNYNHTSLKEFNAILRLYNLEAYRGKEGSRMYQRRGLLYRVLDEHGRYIGVPIKASFFDCKPTLANLEKKFTQNLSIKQIQREQTRKHLVASIRQELSQDPQDLEQLKKKLAQENIRIDLRLDPTGICKDVIYIDLKNRSSITQSEIGEAGNVAAIQKIIDRQKLREKEQALRQAEQKALQQTQRTTRRPSEEQTQRPRLRLSL